MTLVSFCFCLRLLLSPPLSISLSSSSLSSYSLWCALAFPMMSLPSSSPPLARLLYAFFLRTGPSPHQSCIRIFLGLG